MQATRKQIGFDVHGDVFVNGRKVGFVYETDSGSSLHRWRAHIDYNGESSALVARNGREIRRKVRETVQC